MNIEVANSISREYISPYTLSTSFIQILGATYSLERLLLLGISLTIVLIVICLLRYTWFGKSLRATSQNIEGAILAGIDIKKVNMLSFAFGIILSAVSGITLGKIISVTPTVGHALSLKAFAITIFGGLGSVEGALIGSLILGVGESFFASFLSPAYREAFAFILMMVTLMFRPEGLCGKRA